MGRAQPWWWVLLLGGLGGVLLGRSLSVEEGAAGLALLALTIYWSAADIWRCERRAFFLFNAAYFLAYIGAGLWFLRVSLAQADLGNGYALVIWFAACLLQALLRVPVALAFWWMRHRSLLARGAVVCLLWTGLDFGSNLWDFWFPLLPIGYAGLDSWLSPLIPIGGVYLAQYAVLLGALCCTGVLRTLNFSEAKTYLIVGVGIVLSCFWASRQTWTVPEPSRALKVAMVQTNFRLDDRYSLASAQAATKLLASQLAQVPQDTDLVILPEGVFGLMYQDIPEVFFKELQRWSQERETYLAMGVFLPGRHEGDRAISFSALLFDPQTLRQAHRHSQGHARYDKHDLIPLAEKTPAFLEGLPKSWVRFSLTRGERGLGGAFHWDIKGLRLSPSLCYEILFGESQRSAARHADILLNMAMSRWFDGTQGLSQLRKIARVRALEAGRPLLRTDHFGYTQWVSPTGGVVSSLPLGTAQILTASVAAYQGETPYFKWGAWVWTWVAGLFLLLASLRDFQLRSQRS